MTNLYLYLFRGFCFHVDCSYFHYNDAETMKQIISYQIDLNLRFKTHSHNGLILWTGRHTAQSADDYLLLGIENGFVSHKKKTIDFFQIIVTIMCICTLFPISRTDIYTFVIILVLAKLISYTIQQK